MPVLAVGPVVVRDRDAANLTERKLVFIGLRVAPYAGITAIEAAGAAVVRSAVGHERSLLSALECESNVAENRGEGPGWEIKKP